MHLLRCSACGSSQDDGNEKIICKCSSCGNVLGGNLDYFVSDDLKDKSIENTLLHLDAPRKENTASMELINCPECGKKILSESKICSYCGYSLETQLRSKEVNHKKNIIGFGKIFKRILLVGVAILAIITLLFIKKSCVECEHEYVNGLITKDPTCTEKGEKTFICTLCEETIIESVPTVEHEYMEEITKEPTYTEEGEKTFTCKTCNNLYIESIPILDREPYNQNIYEQMVKFYNDGDYISALIIGREAIGRSDTTSKINKLKREIFELQGDYIQEQINSAISNKNYDILDNLYYYKSLSYSVPFSNIQLHECSFIKELQGEYRYFDNYNEDIQVEIRGYNLKIGKDQYIFDYGVSDPAFKERLQGLTFEKGNIRKIRTGLIEINYDNGQSIKYQSDIGKEWEEEQEQKKEEKRAKEEKERQQYLANEPKIGMTAEEVEASNWGKPQEINKTTYEWGITEQWCYPGYKYIYLEDGKVTAIQE